MNTNLRKSLLATGNVDLLDDINSPLKEEYTDDYFGEVVDNNDPRQFGRCRIRVFNIFGPEIPDDDLPWALPDFTYFGNPSAFVVPIIGTVVLVKFDNGDIYCPKYRAKGLQENNLPSQRTEDYPDTMILYATDDGEYFSVNRKTKETKFVHSSGNTISMDKDGKISITSKDNLSINIDNNKDLNISCKNANITCDKMTVNGTHLEVT